MEKYTVDIKADAEGKKGLNEPETKTFTFFPRGSFIPKYDKGYRARRPLPRRDAYTAKVIFVFLAFSRCLFIFAPPTHSSKK